MTDYWLFKFENQFLVWPRFAWISTWLVWSCEFESGYEFLTNISVVFKGSKSQDFFRIFMDSAKQILSCDGSHGAIFFRKLPWWWPLSCLSLRLLWSRRGGGRRAVE
jgi:hypothetical protein